MIISTIKDSIQIKQRILEDKILQKHILTCIEQITSAFKKGNKVFFCGNGGSAADAQHLAAELSGKFYIDRSPLPAEACHVNSSFITAVANDYSFDKIYSRYIESSGKKNDVLIAISTSGNSSNIISAIEKAKEIGMYVIGLTGESGGKMKNIVDTLINVPSTSTPRIQEAHILIGHIICEQVEKNIFA